MSSSNYIEIKKVDRNWFTYDVQVYDTHHVGHGKKKFVFKAVSDILNRGKPARKVMV